MTLPQASAVRFPVFSSEGFIMHVPTYLLLMISEEFPSARLYLEDWRLVKKGKARFFKSTSVRRLSGLKDAGKLAELFASVGKGMKRSLDDYVRWITAMPVYGVFIDGTLASCAWVRIQLPEIWLIGGVFTRPEYRNRWYATFATSAITKEALNRVGAAALLGDGNYSAIRVYEKIGYRKIWVDVGTGLRP